MRAIITAYQYDGAHRNFDPIRREFRRDHQHWDWRYVITVNEFAIYHRQGFCSWSAACKSLAIAWPRMSYLMRTGEGLT